MSLLSNRMINLANSSNFVEYNDLPLNKISITKYNDIIISTPFIQKRLNSLSKLKNKTEDFSVITSKTVCDFYHSLISDINKYDDDIFNKEFIICSSFQCNIPLVAKFNFDSKNIGLQNHFTIYNELFNPFNSMIVNPYIKIPIDTLLCSYCDKNTDILQQNQMDGSQILPKLHKKLFKQKYSYKFKSLSLYEYLDGGTYSSFMNKDIFLDNYKSYAKTVFGNNITNSNNLSNFFMTSIYHDITQITFSISSIEHFFPNFQLLDLHLLSIFPFDKAYDKFSPLNHEFFSVRKTGNITNEVIKHIFPDGQELMIPNLGYQIVINDFSKSKVKQKMDNLQIVSNSFFIANSIKQYKSLLSSFKEILTKTDYNQINKFIDFILELKVNKALKWKNLMLIYKNFNKDYTNSSWKVKNTYGFGDYI